MQQDVKITYERDLDTGAIIRVKRFSDGRIEEQVVPEQELQNMQIVPMPNIITQTENAIERNKEADKEEKYMSTVEQRALLDHYATSALKTGLSLGVGGLAAPLFAGGALPYTAGALLGSTALGVGLDPEGTLNTLGNVGREFVRPYTSPVESYREDPFGTAAAYLPGLAVLGGIGKPIVRSLGEKLLTRWGSIPAPEQAIDDILGVGIKSMEVPLQTLQDEKVGLTVAQAANNPIAAAAVLPRRDLENVLIKQNTQARQAMERFLNRATGPQFRNWLKLDQEFGEVADILKYQATERYNVVMNKLKNIKQDIFNQYRYKTPPVTLKRMDMEGNEYKQTIKMPAKLINTIDAVAKMSPQDSGIISGDEFTPTLGREFKEAVQEFASVLQTPVTKTKGEHYVSIKSLDLYRQYLDKVIARLEPTHPSRPKLTALRNAVNEDIKISLDKAGLKQSYDRYTKLASEWLNLYNNTFIGKNLPVKSTYGYVKYPLGTVRRAFIDSTAFDDLVKTVGHKEATASLLQYIFRNSIGNTGTVDANILIKQLADNKAKLKYLDKGFRTRLYNFAYGLKAQNRLKLADTSSLEMREANALIKFTGATLFGRTGIQIGTATQATGFLISKSDLARILMDDQAGWLAAKLTTTSITSNNYVPRMRAFLQALSRLGIYAKAGDTIVEFTRTGVPQPITDIN